MNARDDQGRTPLMSFLEEPLSRDMIEALPKAGADPRDVDDRGYTAMDYALDHETESNDRVAPLIQSYPHDRKE